MFSKCFLLKVARAQLFTRQIAAMKISRMSVILPFFCNSLKRTLALLAAASSKSSKKTLSLTVSIACTFVFLNNNSKSVIVEMYTVLCDIASVRIAARYSPLRRAMTASVSKHTFCSILPIPFSKIFLYVLSPCLF